MKVAITGPTGMIGSELTNQLLTQGHEVIAIVNPHSSRLSNLPTSSRLKVIRCDINNFDSIMGLESCDLFYHLAWKSSNVMDRDQVYDQVDNIRISLDSVRLAKSWGAKKYIGAGSQAEYGPVNGMITSKTPISPESGYGSAKYASERLCRILCNNIGIDFCWTRIVSVFGKNDADHTLIKYLINSIEKGVKPSLTKCEQTWDYLYSKDAADALIGIGIKGFNGKIYLIASGESRPLKEYVIAVRDIINPSCELGFGEKDYYPHQPMFLSVDISDLKKDIDFSPKYSFEDGIRDIIKMMHN